MQLKILISIICLILSSNSVLTTKLLKARENTFLKTTENKQILGSSSQFTWTIVSAMRLFKELALTIFDSQNPLDVRRCIDDIENNSELGATPYKELWDKCVQINKEFFSKQQLEQNIKGGAIPKEQLANLNAFTNWDTIIIGEFRDLVTNSRNDFMKKECIPVFSKTRGNVYDLISILHKPEFMGNAVSTTKDQQFIDSQYSIYRRTIVPGAFKRLNDASDKIMNSYRDNMKVITGRKRGIKKAPSPYDSMAISVNNTNVVPVINFFSLKFVYIYNFFNFIFIEKIFYPSKIFF